MSKNTNPENLFTYPNFPPNLEFKEPHFSRYIKFIEISSLRELSKDTYTEKHHIVPRSLGGSDEEENIIILTAREHFIAHMILWKGVGGKMSYALWRMIYSGSKEYTLINSKQYETLRIEISKNQSKNVSGKNNPMYGKTGELNPSYGIKRPESGKWGINNHFYGKKHTQETRNTLSYLMKNRMRISNGKENKNILKKDWATYKEEGWEIGWKKEVTVFINNGVTSKLVEKTKLNDFLNIGWKKGRLYKSEETMRGKNHWRSRKIICFNSNGEIVSRFNSLNEAQNNYGISVYGFLHSDSKIRRDNLVFLEEKDYDSMTLQEFKDFLNKRTK